MKAEKIINNIEGLLQELREELEEVTRQKDSLQSTVDGWQVELLKREMQ